MNPRRSGAVATRCILLTRFPYLCSPIITPVAVMPLPQVITRFSISSGRFSVCAATAVSSVSPYPMILMPYWTIKLFSCAASSFARACKMLWRLERVAHAAPVDRDVPVAPLRFVAALALDKGAQAVHAFVALDVADVVFLLCEAVPAAV